MSDVQYFVGPLYDGSFTPVISVFEGGPQNIGFVSSTPVNFETGPDTALVFYETVERFYEGELVGFNVKDYTVSNNADGSFTYYLDVNNYHTTGNFKPGQSACFAAGTSIATPLGPMSVEDLRAGDQLVLNTGGNARIKWIGHRRAHDTYVVHFRPGCLPVGPDRDLYVSEDHAMFIDGVLVPSGLLVNGETIVREARKTVVFWHVELEGHGILLAEGAPAESYLDTGNRRQYGNCPLVYDPVQAVGDPCAEMILAGSRLEGIRGLLRVPEAV